MKNLACGVVVCVFWRRPSLLCRGFFEGARWSFSSGATAPPAPAAQSKQKPAFSWVSESGLGLEVFSGLPVDPAVADCWTATLHYESRRLSGVHSFFPAYFPVSELSQSLNGLLLAPPQVLLLNGQPGTGKRTLLEFLGLLHAVGCRRETWFR